MNLYVWPNKNAFNMPVRGKGQEWPLVCALFNVCWSFSHRDRRSLSDNYGKNSRQCLPYFTLFALNHHHHHPHWCMCVVHQHIITWLVMSWSSHSKETTGFIEKGKYLPILETNLFVCVRAHRDRWHKEPTKVCICIFKIEFGKQDTKQQLVAIDNDHH